MCAALCAVCGLTKSRDNISVSALGHAVGDRSMKARTIADSPTDLRRTSARMGGEEEDKQQGYVSDGVEEDKQQAYGSENEEL